MNYFDEIFTRLKELLNFKSDKEMYDFMGVIQGTFTNWRRRNSIPYEQINSICINEKLDLNYILNGVKNENITKNENFKEKIIQNLEKLNDKELKYFYHLIESELAKKDL